MKVAEMGAVASAAAVWGRRKGEVEAVHSEALAVLMDSAVAVAPAAVWALAGLVAKASIRVALAGRAAAISVPDRLRSPPERACSHPHGRWSASR